VRRRQRGAALGYLLALIAVLSAASLAWHATFQAYHRDAVRDGARAHARALIQAAWTRARTDLEQGRDPVRVEGQLLGGRVAVRREGAARIVVRARVERGPGEWVRCELRLRLEVREGVVRVLDREEVSG